MTNRKDGHSGDLATAQAAHGAAAGGSRIVKQHTTYGRAIEMAKGTVVSSEIILSIFGSSRANRRVARQVDGRHIATISRSRAKVGCGRHTQLEGKDVDEGASQPLDFPSA